MEKLKYYKQKNLMFLVFLLTMVSIWSQKDIEGKYEVNNVSENTILQFFSMGFKSVEIPVKNRTVINVSLEEDFNELDEVVAIGYTTQKKVNLTGSVAAINSDQLENRSAANVSSLLAGQVPGLTIIQSGGNPGRNAGSINIRGIGTLNNSNPLIIIDGIETGSITELNPEDIENVSVLKDASASAIYGIRAANGVILITTKRGNKNGKLQVKYSTQFGFTDFISFPRKLNSFELATLHNEANSNDGSALLFSDDDLKKFKDGSSPLTHANTDYIKDLFSTSAWRSHNLSLMGGSEKGSYRISTGYLDEEGLINNTGLKRYTFRSNLDRDINKNLKVGLNLSGTFNKFIEPAAGIGWVTHAAFREWANDVLQFPDGRWADPFWSNVQHNSKAYSSDEIGTTIYRNTRIIATGFAEYEILKGLKIKGIASILNDRNKTSRTIHSVDLYKINPSTGEIDTNPNSNKKYFNTDSPSADKVSRDYFDNRNINLQLLLNYEKTLGKHYLKGLLGYQQIETESEFSSLSRRKLLSEFLDQINAGDPSQDAANGNTTNYASRSGFARLNYIFDEKYLIEANIRYDGTSRFKKDLRFDYFPSISLGWRISKENFFKVDAISNLKLRASWGELGNQEIGNYLFLPTYRQSGSYIFGGNQVFGIQEGTIANENLRWEKTTSKNIGIDFGMFKNKLNISGDYFVKDTDDILFTLPKPAILGANPPVENAASVRNSGFEIIASFKNRVGNVKYYINANLASVKNKITDLAGAETPGRRVGDPIRNLFGYRTDGLFKSKEEIDAYKIDQTSLGGAPQPGDVKYVDISGPDGVPDGIINDKDRVSLGSLFPKVNYGFSFGLSVKGFDFSSVWQGVAGVKTKLAGRLQRPFGLGSSPLDFHLDRWTPDNTNASYPRASLSNTSNYVDSDFWVKKADFLKLRNVQLGYTLSKNALHKTGIYKLRLYVSVENLLTLSSFKRKYGFDPEDVTGTRDPLYLFGSNTSNNYPTTRRYVLGLNLTF